MSLRWIALYTLTSISLLGLSACLDTGAKTVGKKTAAATTRSKDPDSFAISLAYRDDTANGRLVQVQGVRGDSTTNLVNTCGPVGSGCVCDFYRVVAGVLTPTPVSSTTVGISRDNNSFSCSIPASVAAADIDSYTRVRLRTTDSTKSTGFLTIKTTLVLQDILGDLSSQKVNKIFRYSCLRGFFEGEGVNFNCAENTENCVTCVNNQQLGYITAPYDYYLFSSATASNSKFAASYHPAICGRPAGEFARVTCLGSTPTLVYGLYNEQKAPFIVRIQMTRAPEGEEPLTLPYGFAALPDNSGNCPTGLVAIRPYRAEPPSITAGSIDGVNPPSAFLNTGEGTLNNTVIEASQPSPFIVSRQPNVVKCDIADGDCSAAQLGGTEQRPGVTYNALTPVVCAIPKTLIENL